MGLVKKGDSEASKEAKAQGLARNLSADDPPLVTQLKEVDDKYSEVEKEYHRELQKLEKEYHRELQKLAVNYAEIQQPLFEERRALLAGGEDGSEIGVAGLRPFWSKAMQNHPAFEDIIQEWDEPVLEYLQDIEKAFFDDMDGGQGFKLVFRFAPNPYFTNTELKKEYTTDLGSPFCGELKVKEIKCSTIEWHTGQDVTAGKVALCGSLSKKKGGRAEKAEQDMDKENTRPSFFRDFFRNWSPENKSPEGAKEQARAMALRDDIIPRAVRWYTRKAAPALASRSEHVCDVDGDEDEEGVDDMNVTAGTPCARIEIHKLGAVTPRMFVYGWVSLSMCFSFLMSASYYPPSLQEDIGKRVHNLAYVMLALLLLLCSLSLARNSPAEVNVIKLTFTTLASISANAVLCAVYTAHKLISRSSGRKGGMNCIFSEICAITSDFPWVLLSHSNFDNAWVWIAALTLYSVLNIIGLGGIINSTIQWTNNPKASYIHLAVISINDVTYVLLAWHECLHYRGKDLMLSQNVMMVQLIVALWVLPADIRCIIEGFLRRTRAGRARKQVCPCPDIDERSLAA